MLLQKTQRDFHNSARQMGADATKEYGHVKQSGSMSWNSLRESSSCDKVEKLLE
jgi:hypothetical protein